MTNCRRLMATALVGAGMAFAACAEATTWWVDDDWYDQGGTGTEAAPFGTIQAAVDAAASGDVIMVKPGTYDQGGKANSTASCSLTNRVMIYNKSLTLKATGSRDDTFIVGKHGSSTSQYYSDNVRCVYALCDDATNKSGFKVRIEGFTLKNGGVAENASSATGTGGGLYALNVSYNVQLVDCRVENCWASRGAGMFGGHAVRTLFIGGYNQYAQGAIAQSATLYHCIGTLNTAAGQPLLHGCDAIGCTFFGNCDVTGGGQLSTADYVIRNCVVLYGAAYRDATHVGGIGPGPFRDLRGTVYDDKYYGTYSSGYPHALEGFSPETSSYQLYQPGLDDFRVMAGTVAATNGIASIMYETTGVRGLWVPDEEDRYLDFYKKPIPTTGNIPAGAIAELAPAAVGGGLRFVAAKTKIFGVATLSNRDCAYVNVGKYPTQVRITKDRFGFSDVFAYWIGADNYTNYRAPQLSDDSFYAMPPPAAGEYGYVGCVGATTKYYVDCGEKGSDENSGTDADSPFKKIATAIAACPESAYSVVYVAEGTYDDTTEPATEVGDSKSTHPTRLAVTNSKKTIRFKGAGKEKSIIAGKRDADQNYYGGCGPNAMRCVYFDSFCVLQGFTLRDGYARYAGDTSDMSSGRGGAVYSAGNWYSPIADCIITNASGVRGSMSGGNYARCEFYNCQGWNTMLRSGACFTSCRFSDCYSLGGAGAALYGGDVKFGVINCSIYNSGGKDFIGGNYNCFNTILYGSSTFANNADNRTGNILYKVTTISGDPEGYVTDDPKFSDTHTLVPYFDSPALTAGTIPTADNYGTNYWRYVTTSLDGTPLVFSAEGRPVVGCMQRAASRVTIGTPYMGTVTPSGTVPLMEGESLTVNYEMNADHPDRPYLGIATNGFTVTTGNTFTFKCNTLENVSVDVLSETNWYVNANATDDSGNGWTPATAKKTLKAIMACDILAGDCVHAAAGDYKEGETTTSDDCPTSNRVEIASGVALVADEGPDVTIIRGSKGTNYDGNGLGGVGCVRCVVMWANSYLRGFTIRDAGTACMSGGNGLKNEGGGVYCDGTTPVVENCIITNCSACRGGGVANGIIRNCRIVQNKSQGANLGSAGEYSYLVGCYIDGQANDNGAFRTPKSIDSCTFNGAIAGYGAGNITIKNSVFINLPCAFETGANCHFSHCAIDTVSKKKLVDDSKFLGTIDDNCTIDSIANLKIDSATGRLQEDSPLIGIADATLAAGYAYKLNGMDAAGGQRIYNGSMDLGAFEYDYRDKYAEKLGLPVKAASENVFIGGDAPTDAVRIPAGEKLTVDTSTASGSYVRGNAIVSSGTLTASVDGVAKATLGDDGEKQSFKVTRGNELELSMSGDASDEFTFADIYPFTSNGAYLLLK